MNGTLASTTESISSSVNPVHNIITPPPIDAVPTSAVLDGAPKKRNYFPWILGILVLLIAVTVFTFYKITKGNSKIQPAPSPSETLVKEGDPTANWKAYINSKHRYSFKYPPNLVIYEQFDKDVVYILSSLPKESTDEPGKISFGPQTTEISINALPDAYPDFEKAVNNRKSDPDVNWKIEETQKYVKFFGNIPYGNGDSYREEAFIKYKNGAISFYEITTQPRESDIFNQILSTFKFLDITTNQINFTLPTSWTKSVEQDNSPFDETEKYERIVLVKGNYRIEIGDPVGGGRANCNAEKPIPSILNNPSLSSVVKRTNPEEPSEATNLQICSNLGFNNDLDYGTKIGFIKYFLPANWNQKILTEMDSIVESITLVK